MKKIGKLSVVERLALVELAIRHLDKRDADQYKAAMKKFGPKGTEIVKDIESLSAQVLSIQSCLVEFKTCQEEVKETLQHFKDIRVNGTVGLEEILRMLYKLTTERRSYLRMKEDFEEWRNSKPAMRYFFKSKIGVTFVFLSVIYALVSILHTLGVPIDPLEVIKFILYPLSKLLGAA